MSGIHSGVNTILSKAWIRPSFGVVWVGGRFGLLAMAVDKGKMLWTQWNPVVVQLQTKDRQSDRVRPTYALVFAPPSELTQTEPNVIQVPRFSRKDATQYGCHLRCQEEHCIWRPEPARGSTLPGDQGMDFHTDDRVNILDARLAEMDDIDDAQGDDSQHTNEEHS